MTMDKMKMIQAAVHAQNVAGDANAAFWMGDIDEGRAEYLQRSTLDSFKKLAGVLGFEVKEVEQ